MSLPYSALRTGDYDESDELSSPNRLIDVQNNNLDSLQASVARLGEISRNLANEIEMQNSAVEEIDESVYDMNRNNDLIRRSANNVQNRSNSLVICLFGLVMLCFISAGIIIYLKYL